MSMTGRVFGRWTVVGPGSPRIRANGKRRAMWLCLCSCGSLRLVDQSNLLSGGSLSCGCYHSEVVTASQTTHGCSPLGRPTAEYRAWQAMINRCTNPNYKSWKHYGGRGITVCQRWLDGFQNFLEDMGLRPEDKQTLDRKNTNGNYEPDNCRWATWVEQANNKRPKQKA